MHVVLKETDPAFVIELGLLIALLASKQLASLLQQVTHSHVFEVLYSNLLSLFVERPIQSDDELNGDQESN